MKGKWRIRRPLRRQETLFRKYLSISLAIVLASFFLLGTVMLVFVSSFWQNEKSVLLQTNAQNIAELMENQDDILGSGNEKIGLQMLTETFAANIEADIFVTDVSGTCLAGAYESSGLTERFTVDPWIMNSVLKNGEYRGNGTLSGVYKENYMIIGCAVERDGQVTGAVFATASLAALNSYRVEILRMFLWAAIAAFAIAFFAAWGFSFRMVQPLRKMAAAARSFGEGDFSVRVEESGQDEIGELAVAFNAMATSLADSECANRSFIANVSHELKTPMTTISGFIDGILDGTIPPDQEKKYLRIVSSETKRLSRLVRTMLDLSRIDNGELHLRMRRFDLTNTMLNALLSFEQRIEEKNLQILGLENAESLYVDGDPDMIHQVLYNLIENAVKFTPDGGYIALKMEKQPGKTYMSIRNSGPGIAPDEVEMVFDRFYKTDRSRNKDKTGMGLGLYIVRTIIRQHGGEITASSIPGDYTEFSFFLPDKQEEKKNEVAPRLKKPIRSGRGDPVSKGKAPRAASGTKNRKESVKENRTNQKKRAERK
ncbi:MAG: ATP-binding protein [Acutalibacteraceae bacterium]